MLNQFESDVKGIDELAKAAKDLEDEISKVIVGQKDVIRSIIISIFSNGHSLLVGVPGLAKTLLVNTISQALGLEFNRIQFTPDLMPSDIIGAEILGEDRRFKFVKGPVFTNVLLADEINRTPPKTQAALLEAMQEKKVTNAGKSFELPQPFFVLATQNPIDQEGTYPLPEAQLDRFMFNIWVDYPSIKEEVEVVKATTSNKTVEIKPVLSVNQINAFQELIRKMPVAENVLEYAVKLAVKTRKDSDIATENTKSYLSWGAGPRASQYLVLGAKTHAALNGKYSPDIEDVKAVAHPILRHRVMRNYKAEADGVSLEKIIESLL
jgi:MoxR-like ATPase